MNEATLGRDEAESHQDDLVPRIQRLGGLELAMLIGMMSNKHCLIQATSAGLDSCANAIGMIAERTFGLNTICVNCTTSMTMEEFAEGLLLNASHTRKPSKSTQLRRASYGVEQAPNESPRGIANVIVAKNLHEAPHLVQMQALELIRTRRIFTRSEVYSAPNPFLFLPLTPISSKPLAKHLNDFLFISYSHHSLPIPDDNTSFDQSDDFQESAQRSSADFGTAWSGITISSSDVERLTQLRDKTALTVEMKRYVHNILVFLRMHRGVAGGVTAKASRDFDFLVRCIAPLNGLSFVTPSIVGLAAKKVYPHRLKLASVEQERSMQYGSDAAAVAKVLDGLTPEIIIEQVLQEVEVPL